MNKSERIFRIAEKRGSFAVEAALLAPLFFLALAALLFLIRLDAAQEQAMYDLAEQADEKAYLAHFLKDEEGTGLLTELYETELLSVPVPLPLFTAKTLRFREVLRYRAFTGEPASGTPVPFSELEEAGSDSLVWVFPRRGERYHKKDCRIVTVYPEEHFLSAAVKRTYSPCETCDPEHLAAGTPVYCFATGKVYHRRSCSFVDRYVISMGLVQAEEEGYSACSYCSAGTGTEQAGSGTE